MAAIFSAMTAVFTLFLRVPIFNGSGYVHLGDTVIYICASLLPLPYAVISSAVGGGLADILSGYAIWAPATVVIKALISFCFSNKGKSLVTKRNILACVVAMAITVVLYYIYEGIVYGNLIVPLYSAPWNVIQSVCSGILYIIISSVLDKMNLKSNIDIG